MMSMQHRHTTLLNSAACLAFIHTEVDKLFNTKGEARPVARVVVIGFTAPYTSLDEPTRNLKNLTDKHAGHK
jgi:hypothetical protein